jgi:hypothetical protein
MVFRVDFRRTRNAAKAENVMMLWFRAQCVPKESNPTNNDTFHSFYILLPNSLLFLLYWLSAPTFVTEPIPKFANVPALWAITRSTTHVFAGFWNTVVVGTRTRERDISCRISTSRLSCTCCVGRGGWFNFAQAPSAPFLVKCFIDSQLCALVPLFVVASFLIGRHLSRPSSFFGHLPLFRYLVPCR